jgi:hypothetical protein
VDTRSITLSKKIPLKRDFFMSLLLLCVSPF